jgi:hypothetical protein
MGTRGYVGIAQVTRRCVVGALIAATAVGCSDKKSDGAAKKSVTDEQAAYLRKAKSIEGTMNVRKLADSAVSYYEAEHADDSGKILPRSFPPSVPLTPAKSCCEQGGQCQPDPKTFSHSSWVALNFSVDDPYSFQYEFTSSGKDGTATFTARAIADIGCTGKKTTLERSGTIGPDGNVVIAPLKTNE